RDAWAIIVPLQSRCGEIERPSASFIAVAPFAFEWQKAQRRDSATSSAAVRSLSGSMARSGAWGGGSGANAEATSASTGRANRARTTRGSGAAFMRAKRTRRGSRGVCPTEVEPPVGVRHRPARDSAAARSVAGARSGVSSPSMSGAPDVRATVLLQRMTDGDASAAEELMPLLYDELREIARHHLKFERRGGTLQTTALVHEAWLRIGGDAARTWEGRSHFLRVTARAMRHVLVDHARAKRAGK